MSVIKCAAITAFLLSGSLAIYFLTRPQPVSPCISYTSEDYASSVSLECFRYLWARQNCKEPVPDGFRGWWLRSPNGGRMVPCYPPNTGERCGAGNYKSMCTYLFRCQLSFPGY